MPSFLVDNAAKGSFFNVLQNSPLYDHIDFYMCKGPGDTLISEMEKLTIGSVNYDLRPVKQSLDKWIRLRIPHRVEPTSYDDIVKGKDRSSSVGMPWKIYYADYGNMVDDLGYEIIAQIAQEIEDAILSGRSYFNAYYIFSKLDKYSKTKLQTSAFRSIQVADLFILFMLQKYFSVAVHSFEVDAMQAFLITNIESYSYKTSLLRGRYTFGVDFTAYDKTETSDLMRTSFRLLASRTCIPDKLAVFLEEAVCCPTYVVPVKSNEVYSTGSSNPSGQFLTSVMNTINHIIMNMICVHEMLGVPYFEYLDNKSEVARMIATGDDGIESFLKEEDAKTMMEQYPILLKEYFGITAKIEAVTTSQGIAPFSPGTLPPYLATVEVEAPGGVVLVPSRFNRMLPCLQFVNSAEASDENLYRAKLNGVSDASLGFDVLAICRPDYPVPQSYLDFRTVMTDWQVEPNRTPWDRLRTYIPSDEREQHSGSNRTIAITNNSMPRTKTKKVKVKQPTDHKIQLNVNAQPTRKKSVKPKRARPVSRRLALKSPHAYLDPFLTKGHVVTDKAHVPYVCIDSTWRYSFNLPAGTGMYINFLWTPSACRGAVFPWIRGMNSQGLNIMLPQLQQVSPTHCCFQRAGLKITNMSAALTVEGPIYMLVTDYPLTMAFMGDNPGDEWTRATDAELIRLTDLVETSLRTRVVPAAKTLTTPLKGIITTTDPGFAWLPYQTVPSGVNRNVTCESLMTTADIQNQQSTVIVWIPPRSTAQSYIVDFASTDGCRFDPNHPLRGQAARAPIVTSDVVASLHNSAHAAAQLGEKAQVKAAPHEGFMSKIGHFIHDVGDVASNLGSAIPNVGRAIYNSVQTGRALRTLRSAAPYVEEVAEAAPLLLGM